MSEDSEGEEKGDKISEETQDKRPNREKKKRSYSISTGDMTDEDKKKKGKITTNENEEEARVDLKVYKDYQRFNGGFKQFLLVQLTMVLFMLFKIGGDYMVGSWAVSEDQHSRFAFYCILYFLFSVVTSLCVAARVASLQYFSWHGIKRMHEQMIARILNAPINLYFDTTPIGRIINRFTKDL